MSRPIIEVRNLSKRYRLGAIGATSIREEFRRYRDRLRGIPHPDPQEFWALRDVSFEVHPGEVVGVIGRNGAGKSTLLKILSRITEPTSGRATLRGRVASLLEVGTGFHPELTGRENVFLNGAILGMTRAEVRRKFDEIVAFAEVEQFIDTPVKHYSSGMYVRLAFAVAAHLEPEILIVDEVLAVGDASFQKKCLGKMQDVSSRGGRTVLFVSHSMPAIQVLCQRVLLLEAGEVKVDGDQKTAISRYLSDPKSTTQINVSKPADRQGNGQVRVVSLQVETVDGSRHFTNRSRLKITLRYVATTARVRLKVLIGVYAENAIGIYGLDSEAAGGLPEVLPANGTLICQTGPLNLSPGLYSLNIAVLNAGEMADYVPNATEFTIEPEDFYGTGRSSTQGWAVALLPQEWRFFS